jgi:hypothetical protein
MYGYNSIDLGLFYVKFCSSYIEKESFLENMKMNNIMNTLCCEFELLKLAFEELNYRNSLNISKYK